MSDTFIIAEVGVNHGGSEEIAIKMIEAASECGADAVKFQTFQADKLVLKGAEKAEYQKAETGTGDQHSMLKELELSRSAHAQLMDKCSQVGVEFMSTPFDLDSAEFLVALGMSRIKISSAEITNHPFLQTLASFGKPLILSTGMATLTEVSEAIEVIREEYERRGFTTPLENALTILHCTSNYPTSHSDTHLRAMARMQDEFAIPVGYSDHTIGTFVSPVAVALGAKVIEKHFTLDQNMPGPDQKTSLEPDQFREMVENIRKVEVVMGSGEKSPVPSELPVREVVRRSIITARNIDQNCEITAQDVALLRPGTGIPPKYLSAVIGKKAKKSLRAGTILKWDDFS